MLTDEEAGVVRRARNTNQSPPKNADPGEYHRATALEALIGFLYVTGRRERMQELLAAALPEEIVRNTVDVRPR
jgi:ribonuclease-3 family protein